MTKPKTQEQLDRATDLRLKKTYGVGLDWYNAQLNEQDGGCAICGDPPGTRRLHIDHDHSWKKVKIKSFKTGVADSPWWASAEYHGVVNSSSGKTKSEALSKMKEILLRDSVRSLLCHRCNRPLILLRDKPELLEKAAEYLREHQNPVTGQECCDFCDGTGLMEGWNKRDGNSCPNCKGTGTVREK